MANSNTNDNKRSVGYINFRYNAEEKIWSISGNFTDANGAEFDLGLVKTGTQCINEGISVIAKQIGPTLAGKGIPRQERRPNQGGNQSGNQGGNQSGAYQ